MLRRTHCYLEVRPKISNVLVEFVISIENRKLCRSSQIKTNYIIMRPNADQRAGQLSLPYLGITKTEK